MSQYEPLQNRIAEHGADIDGDGGLSFTGSAVIIEGESVAKMPNANTHSQTEQGDKTMNGIHFSYIWPMALVVLSNVVYQICAKSVPEDMNPFASLTLTYLIGAAASVALYYALGANGSILREYGKVNWAPLVLGLVIVGLEVGWIYAYKAGWEVSTGFIIQSAVLAGVLLLVGALLYREALTWNKLVGVAVCLIGLVILNLK